MVTNCLKEARKSSLNRTRGLPPLVQPEDKWILNSKYSPQIDPAAVVGTLRLPTHRMLEIKGIPENIHTSLMLQRKKTETQSQLTDLKLKLLVQGHVARVMARSLSYHLAVSRLSQFCHPS